MVRVLVSVILGWQKGSRAGDSSMATVTITLPLAWQPPLRHAPLKLVLEKVLVEVPVQELVLGSHLLRNKGIGIGNTWMTKRYEVDSSMATVTTTCMAAASPTRFVGIGIGKSIGRGIGEGIDVGNQVTEGYEVGTSIIHGNCYYHSLHLHGTMGAASPTRSSLHSLFPLLLSVSVWSHPPCSPFCLAQLLSVISSPSYAWFTLNFSLSNDTAEICLCLTKGTCTLYSPTLGYPLNIRSQSIHQLEAS